MSGPPVLAVLSVHHPMLVRGGAQQSAWALANHLRDSGVRCLFVAADPTSPTKANAHIRSSGLGQDEFLFSPQNYDFFWHRMRDAYAKSALVSFLVGNQVTHVFMSHFMYFGLDLIEHLEEAGIQVFVGLHEMLLSCLANGHMVTTKTHELCSVSAPERCVQCFPEISRDQFYLRKISFQKYLAKARGFVAPSEFLRQRIAEWGIAGDRIAVIPHGVDPGHVAAFTDAAVDGRSKAAHTTYGFFGQLVDSKGVLVLLEAAQHLENRGVGKFQVQINGANASFASDAFRATYDAWIERAKSWINGSVVDRGPYLHETIGYRMAAVDAVVVPSTWWEIYCMVVDEAKYYRRPVIASAIGGIVERVKPGHDGYLVPPGDAFALADAMETMMTTRGSLHPELPAEQGWPVIAQRYLDALGLGSSRGRQ